MPNKDCSDFTLGFAVLSAVVFGVWQRSFFAGVFLWTLWFAIIGLIDDYR